MRTAPLVASPDIPNDTDHVALIGVHASVDDLPAGVRDVLGRIPKTRYLPIGGRECPHPLDVLLVPLGDHSWQALAWALAAQRSLGAPEMVFITTSRPGITDSALRASGLRHVIGATGAEAWLPAAVAPLARLARARRAASEAAQAIPPLPAQAPPPLNHGLFQAEQAFRELYLQALLEATPSRAEAARRAKVPYRTLCNMIAKLQLASPTHHLDPREGWEEVG